MEERIHAQISQVKKDSHMLRYPKWKQIVARSSSKKGQTQTHAQTRKVKKKNRALVVRHIPQGEKDRHGQTAEAKADSRMLTVRHVKWRKATARSWSDMQEKKTHVFRHPKRKNAPKRVK